jgi:hypothetical protein
MNPEKEQTIWCERCGEKLNPNKAVWLELSITDGRYYEENKFPKGHESQGAFSFGTACSKQEIKNK